MLFSRVIFVATSLFAASAHSQITLPIDVNGDNLLGADIDLSLFQNGELVNLDAFANVLSTTRFPSATVGITAVLNLGVITVAAYAPFQTQSVCSPCPANAHAICAKGECACACDAGYYPVSCLSRPWRSHLSDIHLTINVSHAQLVPQDSITGQCVSVGNCPAPNVITPTGSGNSFCKCVSPFVSNGGNGCVLASTMSARSRRKVKKWISHPHAAQASQEVLSSKPSGLQPINPEVETCPDGEKACRLRTGGFECIDTTNALTACGGCVGEGLPGQNCLTITSIGTRQADQAPYLLYSPGALNVQCHNSECQVTSCFRGWAYRDGKCV
ncbi:BQ2448_4614 [Microbotryum intermedium]|uniref:BQ2448_4614 protein n=1 Tax=Microbotryum intermedium TaxID=269621 RepID=A0A238FDK8_9BASI|nr:BQ2448_4614 [Microbotryum intermedium]